MGQKSDSDTSDVAPSSAITGHLSARITALTGRLRSRFAISRRHLVPVYAGIIGVALSIVAYVNVAHWENQLNELNFENLARTRNQMIANALAHADELLQNTVDYLKVLGHPVTRQEFNTFGAQARSHHPEVQALGWAAWVPNSERAAFERAMREKGDPDFEIWELGPNGKRRRAGDRDGYFPVAFRQPVDAAGEVAGFDIRSRPERVITIDRAFSSGKPTAMPLTQLLSDLNIKLSILSIAAVSTGDGARVGFAYAVLSLQRVFAAIMSEALPVGIDIYVYDPSPSQQNRSIYWYPSPLRKVPTPFPGEAALLAGPHRIDSITIGGYELRAIYVPTPYIINQAPTWGAPATLAVGLVGTALLVAYLLISLRRTQKLERLSGRLQVLNERFHAAIENIPHGVCMFDGNQRLVVCNAKYASMYGLSEAQTALGAMLHDLIDGRAPWAQLKDPDSQVPRTLEELARNDASTINELVDGRTISISRQRTSEGGWVSIHQDTTKQKQLERELAAASDAKSMFLATMSHEIRTPMNAVLGLTSSLLDTNLDDDQRRTVVVIHDESQSLLELLNGVLDFQKLEGNRIEFESIAFSIRRLLDGTLQVFEPRAAAKGVALRHDYAADLPAALRGDYARIRQVLLNLLSNAVKFTEEGQVTLAARCLRLEQGMAEIEWQVTDTGVGIADDRVDALFEDFVQADTSINRRFGGSGLGLAICKRIVEKMGGKISVATTPGVGSIFSFTLTLPVAEAPAEVADDRTGEKAFVAHIAALGRRLRILVVDDIATNRLVINKLFKPFDIDIDEANDGSQAVATASQLAYDAILMDIRMPVMNGFEATRAIRTGAGPSAQARIIAFTANAFPDDVKRCAAVGMDDFVAKPVQRQAVIDAILREQRAFSEPSPAVRAAGVASSVAVDDAPLMDRKVFDELAAAVGADTADDILNMFIRGAMKRLESLRHLSRDQDREAIKIEAHSLKSEAASLGLLRLSQLARVLELSSSDIGSGEITKMIDRLDATFELTRPELNVLLAA